jgi:3-hydroxyisobutyrate dehydrogenase-like beta-hydroxyacid dehydrogenase
MTMPGDDPVGAAHLRDVGVIGLGAMGSPVARALLTAGYRVLGHDVDAVRVARLTGLGGEAAASPAEVIAGAPVVLSMLPSAAALAKVCDDIAAGSSGRVPPDAVLAELSTLGRATKVDARDRLAPLGISVLDCGLSGTASQAEQGDLVVYASGDRAAFERCGGAFDAMGRSIHYLGEFGAGAATKLVANHLVALHIAAAAEALLMAQRAGLDLDVTLAALTDGAGTSRMLEVRGPTMVSGAYLPASMRMELFLKDLGLIEALGAEVGSPLPLLAAVAAAYRAAVAAGMGALDTAAMFTWLEDRSHD